MTSVVINGTTGVGKSATLQALGAVLAERRLPHALVDFDYLSLAWPAPADDPFNLRDTRVPPTNEFIGARLRLKYLFTTL